MKQSNSSQKSKENNLDKYFDIIREENYNNTFPIAEGWLRKVNTNLSTQKSERKFIIMKNFYLANKMKLAYTFLILALLVAACNYPVTQNETIGDVMSWSVDKSNKDAISKIENLTWVKDGQLSIEEKNNGQSSLTYKLVFPKADANRINDYKKQLEAISGVSLISLIPLNETITRPVYSAALNKIFKIDINATNMSDEQLKEEVLKQLLNANMENVQIDFEKDSFGNRMIRFKLPDMKLVKDGGFDMTIKDGDRVNRIKEVRKTGDDGDRFKNKTDAEIKQMIKEDFKDENLKDDQIEIIRKDDKVMVKVKKVNNDTKNKLEIEDEIK